MLDIEEIKKDADVLGIAYRADIKAETLQKRIEKHQTEKGVQVTMPKPVEVKQGDTEYKPYKNTTNNNIFTEDGRCSPNKRVMLTADEAKKYNGLESC